MKYGIIAVVATALSLSTAPAATAAETSDPLAEQIAAAQTQAVHTGVSTKAIEKAHEHSTSRRAMTLESKSGYHIYDSYYDGYDSYAYPELLSSAGTVSTTSPDKFIVVGVTETYTSGYSDAGLLIDTNGDGDSDYVTVTPSSYVNLDTGYSTPISKFVNDSPVPTGQYATWVRLDEGYGVAISWRALGVQHVRWTLGTIDSYGDSDFSPNSFGASVDLMTGQYPPPPTPAPAPTTPTTASKKPSPVSLRVKKSGKRGLVARWTKSSGAVKYGVELRRKGNSRWYDTKSQTKSWRNLKPGAYVIKVWPVSKDLTSGATSSHWIRIKK